MNRYIIRALLFFAGFALWAGFSMVPAADGHIVIREAWDRAPYWQIGVPLLMLAQAVSAAASRDSLPRLPLWPLAGHFFAMLVFRRSGTDLGLLPLAAVFIGLPAYGALYAVSFGSRKLAARFA